jgi:hypothetical protein
MGALDAHHTFLLDEDNPMRARGYSNVLVTRADLFRPFEGRNSVVVDGVPTRVLALLPLEPHEWRKKVEDDVDSLFDAFRQSGRDLLCVRERCQGG